ncbi:hypothetical protein [Klebsiella variicola]|uniref:hypothetical protein n=1 Tax=Klebsiella variicola TaxID=244366 RepID=UPI001C25F97A|nr:hypothetical protein [Klebsiella variicola]
MKSVRSFQMTGWKVKLCLKKIVNPVALRCPGIRFPGHGFSTEGLIGKMIIQIHVALAEAECERILEDILKGELSVKP